MNLPFKRPSRRIFTAADNVTVVSKFQIFFSGIFCFFKILLKADYVYADVYYVLLKII